MGSRPGASRRAQSPATPSKFSNSAVRKYVDGSEATANYGMTSAAKGLLFTAST